MNPLTISQQVAERRKRLGVSQSNLAAIVRDLSGQAFSQQALAKFEKSNSANSSFSIYILQALETLERRAGITPSKPTFGGALGKLYEDPETAPVPGLIADFASSWNDKKESHQVTEIKSVLDTLEESEIADVLVAMIDKVRPKTAAKIAQAFFDKAKSGL